jgi:hypothetical protein
MVSNFLMGGKLGDFLHAMFAVKHICLSKKTKANIYMYDIGWEFGIKNTHSELKDIFLHQDYVNSFNILEDCKINPVQTPENNTPIKVYDKTLIDQGYVDLGSYIRSPWLYKTCWSNLYSKTFNFDITGEYAWIKYNNIDLDLVDKVLVHRRDNIVRINNEFPYDTLIEEYKDRLIFVSGNEKDYTAFSYRDRMPFLKMNTLEDWFTSINSSLMLVSNLSSPAVIAHSLDKTRIIELPNLIDSNHCIGEELYSKNVFWYVNSKLNNLT